MKGRRLTDDVLMIALHGVALSVVNGSFEELFPRASIEGLRLTASWWGTGGASELEA